MITLTKQTIVNLIQVDINNILHLRESNQILEDGKITHEAYHRLTLTPGSDITGQDPRVIAIANALWTPEIISAYQASQNENISAIANVNL